MGTAPLREDSASMFRMIGQYEIRRDGDLISVWSASEFNVEAAQAYARDMLAMIERMPPKFGVLVEFDSPPIMGPDVEESMRNSARGRAERGMVAAAFVTHDIEGLTIAREQWHRIYDPSGIAFDFFRDTDAAKAFLQRHVDAARAAAGPAPG
jgi:hypothetical protein